MRKTGIWIIALAIAAFIAYGSTAMAGKKGRGGKGRGGPLKVLKTLDLTEDQETRIKEIVGKQRGEVRSQRDQMIPAREALEKAIHSDQFNESAVRQAFKEVVKNREEMVVLRAKMMSEIRSILTPDQVRQWDDHRAKRRQEMKARFEKRLSEYENL